MIRTTNISTRTHFQTSGGFSPKPCRNALDTGRVLPYVGRTSSKKYYSLPINFGITHWRQPNWNFVGRQLQQQQQPLQHPKLQRTPNIPKTPKKKDPNEHRASNLHSLFQIEYDILAAPLVSTLRIKDNKLPGADMINRGLVVLSVPAVNPQEHQQNWERLTRILNNFSDKTIVPIAIPTYTPEEEDMVDEDALVGQVHYLMGVPVYLTKPVPCEPSKFPHHDFFEGYKSGKHQHFDLYPAYPNGQRIIKPVKKDKESEAISTLKNIAEHILE